MSALLAAILLVPAGPVKVGSKSFTESVILGEMIRQLLEARGIKAEHRADLGGTQILFKGLKRGDLDVYVEYTGTLTQELLASRRPVNEAQMRSMLAEEGVVMGGRLGFVNNYALGVPRGLASRLGLKTISDLKKHPDLRAALSNEFLGRKDGWPLLASRYGLSQRPTGMTHETALSGLVHGKSDLTDLYSTDPEIAQYDLIALEDDLGALPLYHAVILWRSDLDPKAADVLKSLEGKIDTERMVLLNASVRVSRVSETAASAEFLNEAFGLELKTGESRWRRLAWGTLVATGEHLLLVLVSLAVSVAVAVPLGVVSYTRPHVGKVILGVVGVIQTIPSMALLVLLIPPFGLGWWPALVALILYGLLPIVRNTYQGLRDLPLSMRESAEVIGLPPRARLWRVELPLASRSILLGVKTAAIISVGTATIGALVGAGGYGQPIITGLRLEDWPLILSGAVPAALMALGVQGLFALIEPLVVPRGLRVA